MRFLSLIVELKLPQARPASRPPSVVPCQRDIFIVTIQYGGAPCCPMLFNWLGLSAWCYRLKGRPDLTLQLPPKYSTSACTILLSSTLLALFHYHCPKWTFGAEERRHCDCLAAIKWSTAIEWKKGIINCGERFLFITNPTIRLLRSGRSRSFFFLEEVGGCPWIFVCGSKLSRGWSDVNNNKFHRNWREGWTVMRF